MARDNYKYSLPIENLPDGFAYHQVITDNDGKPVDYIFLEVNPAFEKMTGLKREEVVGKKVTEVLPGIEIGNFNWIGTYGQVALSGKPARFESYSEPLGRWYEVSAYSDKPGFVALYFNDITKLKQAEMDLQYQEDQMKLLLDVSKTIATENETAALAQSIVDGITKLTRLKSAAIYLLHNKKLYLKATYPPLPPDFPESLRIAEINDHPHIGEAISSKNPVVMEDSRNEVLTNAEREVCELRQLRSILYVPLTYQGEVIGVLIPSSVETTHVFTDDEIKICQTLAGHAALSLAEAMLAEEKQNYIKEIEEKNKSLILKEKAIRESEERLDLAMSVKNEGIWDWNLITDETFFDERYYTMAGYKPYEFPQSFTAWADRVHKEDLPRAQKAIRDYLDGLSSKFDIEFRFMKKDGQWMWINGKGKIYERDASGKPARIVGTHTDITDRKQTQEKLEQEKSEKELIINNLAEQVAFLDPEMHIIWANSKVIERHNLGTVEYKGKKCYEVYHQLSEPCPDCPIIDVFKTGLAESGVHRSPDGYYWQMTGTPMFDDDGKIIGVLDTALDISDLKAVEEELKVLNINLEKKVKERTIKLEALNKELESFAYSVSHDLRTPLRAIEGFSSRLNEKYIDQFDEQGQHYLNRIRNNTSNMSKLIDDLLKLSRVSRTEINLQEVDLSHLAKECVKLMQETNPVHRVEIEITTDLLTRGDQALLRVMLENLLNNAWKFSSQEAQAKIEIGRAIIDGEEVFYVRDNGVGFDMTYADKLFGTFQRLHSADEFRGTGIGLATVQRIINRHGGKVWAEGEVGKGATFYFSLPV